eukprot:CAMPEP_0184486170 /NCGR_PEP_ID=MMETSP0113_2-20130426/7704_1 /TAXON_ID=91329 /ORGANISM="Norrisiella sphaerica, Strain BC52" /LENGTH=763 /DNA_ID=CAMNT_0026867919 /DNA_START=194 /DNA_END=2485 /DNA_ORIENTATION=+
MSSIDAYDCGRMIGKGSFGEVFLCQRKRTGDSYVMKKMRLVNVPKKEMQSFQLEVRLLSELAHPGIVEYVESFITGDQRFLCIVMGYCEGGDLTSFLKKRRNRPLPEKDILNLFVQITLALHFVHTKNILHRDLKSQNIFLKDGMIQLGDFGISKVLDSTAGFAQTCIGTPYYMSPELFEHKAYNFKSDVWALGCILYEMATLKHAFDANNLNGLAMKIIRGKYPPISSTYSLSLRNLVKGMLNINPTRRPSIKKILKEKIVLRRLKIYLTKVFRESGESQRKKKNLLNCREQLSKLGLKSVLEDIEAKQKKKVAKVNATDVAMQKKWKEQQSALQKEEAAQKRMEEALAKYKEGNQRLKRRLLEKKNRAAKRAESVKRRSTPAEIRQRKKLEDARKRRDLLKEQKARRERDKQRREEKLKKEREAERKRIRDLDSWAKRNAGLSVPSSKRTSSNGSRQTSDSNPSNQRRSVMEEQHNIQDDMEDNQTDLQHLQKAREAIEQALAVKDARRANRPSRLETPKKSSSAVSHMSPKDRVLYEKEQRKKAEEAKKRAELLAAQQQLVREKQVAEDRKRALYRHSMSPDATDEDDDEDVDDEDIEQREKLEEELSREVAERNERIFELKRTLGQTRVAMELNEDEEDDETTDQEGGEIHNHTANICVGYVSDSDSSEDEASAPGPISGIRERFSALKKTCIEEMGERGFKEAYEFVKRLNSDPILAKRGETYHLAELSRILGSSNKNVRRAYDMLDHLHFTEASFRR